MPKKHPGSYGMYVNRWGKLTSHEVQERPDSLKGYKKEAGSIQTAARPLSNRQRADLKKDLVFKLLLGSEQYKKEVILPFHKAFWGHLTTIRDLTPAIPPLTASTVDTRTVNPDVVWQDPKTGAVFLTEMQRRRQEFYSQRISLYEGRFGQRLPFPVVNGTITRFRSLYWA
ncbi:PD-(D/E)XK nuclease family transposase [Arachidicoccus terrestris]|uniref:PD-(D/E)XK nuclease family transposase n=1 Tax=Arachidicoccus terrestris TaxID=2875539 RepID=UPI0021D4790F|nr:PD-(D/E)XK nuclease family transposase [Arachidicoccus terrestris]UAY55423.1 PD-(D/E)XK nuclease family transposase [Arachidicoccus terrestris]